MRAECHFLGLTRDSIFERRDSMLVNRIRKDTLICICHTLLVLESIVAVPQNESPLKLDKLLLWVELSPGSGLYPLR